MAEPYGDEAHFRASLGLYEGIMNPPEGAELPRLMEQTPTETLILYGAEDRIVGPQFPKRMALACPDHVGPFLLQGAGHFLQWEQADTLNRAIVCFCRDLV
jgi:pimeloyl-ACP methyl ester carboxylesterase